MTYAPKTSITWGVQSDDVIYWMHYADHSELRVEQRQAVRHLRDCLLRLVRLRDAVDKTRDAFTVNALTGKRQPTRAQAGAFFEATSSFFQAHYVALSAWSSLLVRLASPLKLNIPSTSSMKSFLDWLGGRSGFMPIASSRIQAMDAAREFRAVLDHPGQFQPFEWDIFDDGEFVERIRLYGPLRGKLPAGAQATSGPLADTGGWSFVAPGTWDVTNAVAELMQHFMPVIAGQFPLVDDSNVTCPDFPWEREWNGDRPVDSEPLSLYKPGEALIDPSSGTPVLDPTLTKGVSRCPISAAAGCDRRR